MAQAKNTKTPSAAEIARREAQSKADKGEAQPIDLVVDGVSLTVDPNDLDDADALFSMQDNDFRPMLNLLFPGMSWAEQKVVLEPLNDPETGRLRYSRIIEFVGHVFEAVGQGN